jgi:glucan phosphoethanolaminetransferase (alkaline phosphatase superfamily)
MAMILSVTASVFVAAMSAILLYYIDTNWISIIAIPAIAYVVSTVVAIVYQLIKCGSLNPSVAVSNLFVLGTTFIASTVLFLEQIPFWKPTSASSDAAVAVAAAADDSMYKIQIFSSIVKAVLPTDLSESMKTSAVYFYWIFWMTILPLFFIMSIQDVCR